jgi:hypothetical protein
MLFLHIMQAHDVLRRTQQLRAQQKAAGAVTSGSQHKPAQGPTVRCCSTVHEHHLQKALELAF